MDSSRLRSSNLRSANPADPPVAGVGQSPTRI